MKTKAEKYPVLWAEFQRLQARRAAIEETNKPLREQQSELRAKQDELRAQEAEVFAKIKVHTPELVDIDAQLSGLARAMGGESLNS